jgi:hypothetical protein
VRQGLGCWVDVVGSEREWQHQLPVRNGVGSAVRGSSVTSTSLAAHGRAVLPCSLLVLSLLLSACEQSPTALTTRQSFQRQFAAASRSPLEQSTFDVEISITVTDLSRGEDRKDRTRAFPVIHATGRIVHGTGYADLRNAMQLNGLPAYLPVLETNYGRQHGAPGKALHGITRDGRRVGLEQDQSDDGGPIRATRISHDERLAISGYQDWQGSSEGWRLHRLTLTLFQENVPARETTVSVKIGNVGKAESAMSPRYWGAEVADALHWVGAGVAGAIMPTPLYGQEIQDVLLGWLDKVGNAVGAAVGAVGIIIESWTLAVVGGIIIAFTTAVNLGAWIGQQTGITPSFAATCESYKQSVEADPSNWDIGMESFCSP